jgi:hypothetical protein
MPGELGRHLRMERMPAQTPASVFSGEGPERFPLGPSWPFRRSGAGLAHLRCPGRHGRWR